MGKYRGSTGWKNCVNWQNMVGFVFFLSLFYDVFLSQEWSAALDQQQLGWIYRVGVPEDPPLSRWGSPSLHALKTLCSTVSWVSCTLPGAWMGGSGKYHKSTMQISKLIVIGYRSYDMLYSKSTDRSQNSIEVPTHNEWQFSTIQTKWSSFCRF